MRLSLTTLLLITCIISSSRVLHAQDLIVTPAGDSLKGAVKILTYDKIDRAQVVIEKKKKVLTAMQVKSLTIDGEVYRPVRSDAGIQFMKVLKDGYLTLLAFRQPNQMTYGGLFLTKKDGRGIEVPNIGFRKSLIKFLEECPEVTASLEAEKYKRSDINQIVDDFNTCISGKTNLAWEKEKVNEVVLSKSEGVLTLLKKIEPLTWPQKQDATDLLNDIKDKIERQQNVPNYQLETLRNLLSSQPQLAEDVEKLVASMKGN